jgi:hypothetical protein
MLRARRQVEAVMALLDIGAAENGELLVVER